MGGKSHIARSFSTTSSVAVGSMRIVIDLTIDEDDNSKKESRAKNNKTKRKSSVQPWDPDGDYVEACPTHADLSIISERPTRYLRDCTSSSKTILHREVTEYCAKNEESSRKRRGGDISRRQRAAKRFTSKLSGLTSSSATLLGLPTELVLEIFSHLKAVPATILALTCKRFWAIHRKSHLDICKITQQSDGQKLYVLLQNWMGKDLVFASPYKRFVPVAFWGRVLEERRETQRILREKRSGRSKALLVRRAADQEAAQAARRAQRKIIESKLRRALLVQKLRLSRNMSEN